MTEFKGVTEDLVGTARDAAYVAVGLGVLAVQRAQVRRNELMRALEGPRTEIDQRLGEVREQIGRKFKYIDGRVEQVIETLEAQITPIEERLPEPARDFVKQARTQARDMRQQIRHFLAAA